ncbi:MAG: sugar transporter substrate-binding protein [Bacteriovoracaceae bacterium]|nr:sugar transporter substrate-binding protein [Bacteriovoracaceae bacterium]
MKITLTFAIGILLGGLGLWVVQTVNQKGQAAQKTATVHEQTTKGANDQNRKIVIGFSVPGTDHSWLGAIKRNAEEAAKDLSDVELVLTDAQNSSEKQMADIESLIQRKVDVIVMLPHSGKALTPAAKKIKDAGIPLVILDRKIESQDFYTSIVGDNYGIGQAAAQYIGHELKGIGKVAEVMGLAGISVTTERHNGFVNTLKQEFPSIEVIASLAADFSADKALTVTENILQSHPDILAIYSHDDDMNVGVLQALHQNGKADKVFVTGAGGTKLMMENIKKGMEPVRATFLYNPSMAGSAVNLAHLIALKKGLKDLWEPEVVREITLRASTVTQANVDRFLQIGY